MWFENWAYQIISRTEILFLRILIAWSKQKYKSAAWRRRCGTKSGRSYTKIKSVAFTLNVAMDIFLGNMKFYFFSWGKRNSEERQEHIILKQFPLKNTITVLARGPNKLSSEYDMTFIKKNLHKVLKIDWNSMASSRKKLSMKVHQRNHQEIIARCLSEVIQIIYPGIITRCLRFLNYLIRLLYNSILCSLIKEISCNEDSYLKSSPELCGLFQLLCQ